MLKPGDATFVATDGVIEAMNAEGGLYTLDRLNTDLRAAVNASAVDLVRIVTDNVHAFTGSAPKADDVTALALRWRPS
jgi:serine phosphatase RsbU (regulator of sigma subunit)